MLNRIIAVISFLVAGAFYFFRAGKKSVELKDNENAAKGIQAKNKFVDDTRKYSDSELDKRVSKYTKRTK